MVVKYGQDAGKNSKRIQETSTERDNANLHTSFFVSDTRRAVEGRQPEFSISANNIQSAQYGKADFGYPTPDLTDGVQTNRVVPAYANISYMSLNNEVSVMTENNRPAIVVRRTSSFDSTEGQNSPRNSMKYESEYECMSSPESFSNSSSNRSSNTSSFYGNISPDTLSLASFAGRFNIGRFSTGSKRSSQSSSASSQDSGRQSWGKIRDSFDLSDGVVSYIRRPSGEHVYENTRPFTPDNFMRFSRVEANHMEVTDQDDDLPPPLPTRQNQQPVSTPTKEEPEMILPYKIVDLDELQRSLEDIEPYYIHNGSERPQDVDSDFYNDVPDPIEKDNEPDSVVTTEHNDFRPDLPPKKRPLSHSQSDSCFNATELSKERPTPLPRQSLILSDLARVRDGTVQNPQTDESTNLAERAMSTSGHIPRAKSPPSERCSRIRQNSASPHRNARPMRSAPPPPPRRSLSPGERVLSNRPVSEMFPHTNNTKTNSPKALKRSHTVSLLQSPFNRRPVDSISQKKTGSGNSAQNSNNPTTTLPSCEPADEKNKDDATKASKKGAFLKKALSNLKLPGTKKAAKKELTIGPPTDFTSLYQTGMTTDYSNREQDTISSLTSDDACDEPVDCDSSAVVGESAGKECKLEKDEWEFIMEDPEEPMEQLSFHPEFTELPLADISPADEQFYYNFPISHADSAEKVPTPKKPPRSGYLQPSLSQLTKEREEEISQNIAPELGPLPTPPEGKSRLGTPNSSVISTPESDAPTLPTIDKNWSVGVTPEDTPYSVTTPESEKKQNNFKVEKPSRKPKPEVPCRPSTLKLKPKVPNRPVLQSTDKPTLIPRSLTLGTATIQKSREMSTSRNKDRRHSTPLEESTALSRSCDSLGNYEQLRDDYITEMHLTVIKDILRCWRNMLRKPTISLAGACWEDFEIVESSSPVKVSEDQGSVSLPVRLRKESTNLDSNNSCGKYIAKIKCQTEANGSTKSLFDQDYSVCTSLESHENVSRVLAYFRGEIESSILGMASTKSPLHTTISISDQVPALTCFEFVAQSKEAHSKDPLSYERTVCMLMLQCLRGIAHLHNSGFTHGNLDLNSLFLIKHNHDYQLFIGNFGKTQPLANERRSSALYSKIDDSPVELTSAHRNDFAAISEIFTAMLHQDQNGNGMHTSKASYSSLSEYLRKASERLRDGSASSSQVVCFLQALLWGPFKLGENMVIVSESRMRQWLDRQRSEFIARLAMDEALSRTVGGNSRKFSMEDLLLCDYLSAATASSLVKTEKCWFLAT